MKALARGPGLMPSRARPTLEQLEPWLAGSATALPEDGSRRAWWQGPQAAGGGRGACSFRMPLPGGLAVCSCRGLAVCSCRGLPVLLPGSVRHLGGKSVRGLQDPSRDIRSP